MNDQPVQKTDVAQVSSDLEQTPAPLVIEQLPVQNLMENLTIQDPKHIATPQQPQNTQFDEPDKAELTLTKYFVEISRTNIMFGKSALFPGSIEEFDLSIGLKDEIIEDNASSPFILRVTAKCTNPQFTDLDEYVFSVRSNQRFEYFEEVRFRIRKRERAIMKVAVKVPQVRQSCVIEGVLQIQLQSLTAVLLPIYLKCQVPQIICVKDLYKPDEDTQVIKIPAKKNQIRMPPIPFKNLSNYNLTIEVEAIANESFNDKPYDVITQNFVNCQPNSQFFVNIQLKENMSYKGNRPSRDYIRKILILKIKGSSIYYNYPMEILVFQGNSNTGIS